MKAGKVILVIVLFAVAIYMAFGLKKRIVQNSCDVLGDYEATKGQDVIGSDNTEAWYCCPANVDRSTKDCVYHGE